jgi:hypothetical protein
MRSVMGSFMGSCYLIIIYFIETNEQITRAALSGSRIQASGFAGGI